MAINIGLLREEHERRKSLRERGVTAAQGVAQSAQGAVRSAEQAFSQGGKEGTSAIRQQGARALAAGLSQNPGTSGGGGLAAARQTALDTGGQIAEFTAGRQERHAVNLSNLKQSAAMAGLEALQFEREAGSETSEAMDALAELEPVIQGIIARHKGNFGDDERAMSRELITLANQQSNPKVRDALLRRAVVKGNTLGGVDV